MMFPFLECVMAVNRRLIPIDELTVVASLEDLHDSREPPLFLGNRVCLNSDGPALLVVDVDGDAVTVAWHSKSGEYHEHVWPAICLHRIRQEVG
jgi:hypothetical protein